MTCFILLYDNALSCPFIDWTLSDKASNRWMRMHLPHTKTQYSLHLLALEVGQFSTIENKVAVSPALERYVGGIHGCRLVVKNLKGACTVHVHVHVYCMYMHCHT